MITTAAHLWKRASLWRTALSAALFFTVMAIFYAGPARMPAPSAPAPGTTAPGQTAASATSSYIPQPVVAPADTGAMPKFGEEVKEKMYFGGRFIPLPVGDWKVVGFIPAHDSHGTTINTMALVNLKGDTVMGMLLLAGNEISMPVRQGFRSDGNCQRTDINYINVTSNSDFGPQECQSIDYVDTGSMDHAMGDRLLAAAGGEIKSKQYKLPTTLIGPSFRFANNGVLLMARYLFNPEADGIPPPKNPSWGESDWNKYTIAKYPDKQAYLNRLIVWTNKYLAIMRQAFDGKMTEDKVPTEYATLVP